MIISHKYKYIFLRPKKVAGTSIEVSLAQNLGKEDIIAEMNLEKYIKNDSKLKKPDCIYLNLPEHMLPSEVKSFIGKKIWGSYYKFTIVRNPWDMIVSRFFHNKHKKKDPNNIFLRIEKVISRIYNMKFSAISYISYTIKKMNWRAYMFFKSSIVNKNSRKDFEYFTKNISPFWKNTPYYFTKNGKPICDYYIRFEDLDKDFKKVCIHLNIPYVMPPRTRNKSREIKHYSTCYTKETIDIIRKVFLKEIIFFNYSFKKMKK